MQPPVPVRKKTGGKCQKNASNRNKPLSVFNKNLLSNVNKNFAVLRLAGKKNYIQTKIELTLVQPCVWRPGPSRNLITLIPSPNRLLKSMMTVSRTLTRRGACKVLKLARVTLKDSRISSIMTITKEHITYFSPSRRHCAT